MSTFALHTHTHVRGEGETPEEEGNTREGRREGGRGGREGGRRDGAMYVIAKSMG